MTAGTHRAGGPPSGGAPFPDGEPLSDEGLRDPFDVMLLGWSFVRSRVVATALELGLFDALADAPLTEEEVRARLDLHPRALRDFLDTLTALGLLCREDGRYRDSLAATRHLRPGTAGYVGGFLDITTELMGRDHAPLTGLLRTGNARGQGHAGEVPFTAIFADPVRLEHFLGAMDGFSGAVGGALVSAVDWSRYETFADIGGARGRLAADLATAHPHLTGTVLDRPAFAPLFARLAAERAVADRLSYVGGDFFTDELPSADVLVLGGVLHDWTVDRRGLLLRRAAEAVRPGGCVVVYDTMLDDARSRPDNLLLSLVMMLQSSGATGFTPEQCAGWLEDAGLKVESTLALPARNTAIVARKPG